MSKFDNLSHLVAAHEIFWSKLGAQHTASDWPELADFLRERWDPFFTKWEGWELRIRSGLAHLEHFDMFVREVANALSHVRASAVHEYGLPIPDIGSSGPGAYAGAVSLIGAFGLDQMLQDQMRRNLIARTKSSAKGKAASGRRSSVSDHRSNPGGYDARALTRPAPRRKMEISDAVQQLRDQEASYQDDGGDDGDAQGDVASGWWSDAVHFVKKHTSDIKSAAQYAAGAIGGKLGEQIAGAAVDATLGDPVAAKKIEAAINHPDPKIAALAIASVAATKQVIEAKQVQVIAQPHRADPALSLMASWA